METFELGVVLGPVVTMAALGVLAVMARIIWRDYKDVRRQRAWQSANE